MKNVIKLKTDVAERILNQSLKQGVNRITLEVKIHRSILSVKFDAVVPLKQHNQREFCFIIKDDIEVIGRGSVKYEDDAWRMALKDLLAERFTESPLVFKDGEKKAILAGFNEECEGVYTTVYCLAFPRGTSSDDINVEGGYILTTPHERIIYRNNNGAERFLTSDGVYSFNHVLGNCCEVNFDKILFAAVTDEDYILDRDKRSWKKITNVEPIVSVQGSFQNELIVYNDTLYRHVSLVTEMFQNCISYQQRLYTPVKNANVIALSENVELVPLFRTNLVSGTKPFGSGLYSAVEINGENTVVVPVVSGLVDQRQFKLGLIKGEIYSIVGKYEDVGFSTLGEQGCLKVTTQPGFNHIHFYPSFIEIKADILVDQRERVQIEFFDDRFQCHRAPFEVGDVVKVMEELTDKSTLVGLIGPIVQISPNKRFLTVEFFGHFQEKFSVDSVLNISKHIDPTVATIGLIA